MCDRRYLESHPTGMAYAKYADAYAVSPGASEAGWTVREGVKYEWVVGPSTCPAPQVPQEIKAFEQTAKARLEKSQLEKDGTAEARRAAEAAAAAAAVDLSNPFLPFNASVFCERVGRGRRILVVGDSKQYQMVESFLNLMAWDRKKPAWEMVGLEDHPKRCVDVLGGDPAKMAHEFCQWKQPAWEMVGLEDHPKPCVDVLGGDPEKMAHEFCQWKKPAWEMVGLEDHPKPCVDVLGGDPETMAHEFCQWKKPAWEMVGLEDHPKPCVDVLGGDPEKMAHEFCQCPVTAVHCVGGGELKTIPVGEAIFPSLSPLPSLLVSPPSPFVSPPNPSLLLRRLKSPLPSLLVSPPSPFVSPPNPSLHTTALLLLSPPFPPPSPFVSRLRPTPPHHRYTFNSSACSAAQQQFASVPDLEAAMYTEAANWPCTLARRIMSAPIQAVFSPSHLSLLDSPQALLLLLANCPLPLVPLPAVPFRCLPQHLLPLEPPKLVPSFFLILFPLPLRPFPLAPFSQPSPPLPPSPTLSPSSLFPQSPFAAYPNTSYPWNPLGSSLHFILILSHCPFVHSPLRPSPSPLPRLPLPPVPFRCLPQHFLPVEPPRLITRSPVVLPPRLPPLGSSHSRYPPCEYSNHVPPFFPPPNPTQPSSASARPSTACLPFSLPVSLLSDQASADIRLVSTPTTSHRFSPHPTQPNPPQPRLVLRPPACHSPSQYPFFRIKPQPISAFRYPPCEYSNHVPPLFPPPNPTQPSSASARPSTACLPFSLLVSLLSDQATADIRLKAEVNSRQDFRYPLYLAEFDAIMTTTRIGATTSQACLDNLSCLPLGGYSVMASLPPIDVSSKEPSRKPLVIAMAQMDAASLFRDAAVGAESPISGLISLLAAADAIASLLRKPSVPDLPKQLVILALNGERWGYLGSRRLLFELEKLSKGEEGVGRDVLQGLSIEDFTQAQMLEVGSMGMAGAGGNGTQEDVTLFMHHEKPMPAGAAAMAEAMRAAAASIQRNSQDGETASAAEEEGQEIVGVRVEAASEETPGFPPSSLLAMSAEHPGLAALHLSDYNQQVSNPYLNSHLDTLPSIHLPSLTLSSTLLARSLLLLSGAPPSLALQALVNTSLISNLVLCLLSPSPGLLCPLASSLLTPRDPAPSHYAGVFLGVPPSISPSSSPPSSSSASSPPLYTLADTPRFIWNFLAKTTAVKPKGGEEGGEEVEGREGREVREGSGAGGGGKGGKGKECVENGECGEAGEVCVGVLAMAKGECMLSSTTYIPALSPRLVFNSTHWSIAPSHPGSHGDRVYILALSPRLVFNSTHWSIAPPRPGSHGDQVDPVWTESFWQHLKLRSYLVDDPIWDASILLGGVVWVVVLCVLVTWADKAVKQKLKRV
ncbi:unnamed protein product [Closterium sp. Naga37s-1]|nr:unnamed protein product [Closterium sp. Naga37s-1]